jgi:hypothetical protein
LHHRIRGILNADLQRQARQKKANGTAHHSERFDWQEQPRAEDGTWGEGGGSGGESAFARHETGVKLGHSTERAFNGKQDPNAGKLSKSETGKLTESIVAQYLQDQGFPDARPLNMERNNFPIDGVYDHAVFEIKGGLASNGASAQQWRLTIGEPGAAEKAKIAAMDEETRARYHEAKQQAIVERKEKAIEELSQKLGRPLERYTMTVILNPATGRADIYKFDGFHQRIGWNSAQAKAGHVASVSYAKKSGHHAN